MLFYGEVVEGEKWKRRGWQKKWIRCDWFRKGGYGGVEYEQSEFGSGGDDDYYIGLVVVSLRVLKWC